MNLLSQFKTSLFSECNTPAEFGQLAAQYDDKFEVHLPRNEIMPLYKEFFDREWIVSFNEEEWEEYITAYRAQVDKLKST